MPLPKPTPPDEMTGRQLARALGYLLHRFRDQLNRHDWDTLHEASRRLNQHEGIVRDVLPDLRNRISEPEGALVRLLSPGVATALLLDGLRPAREKARGRRRLLAERPGRYAAPGRLRRKHPCPHAAEVGSVSVWFVALPIHGTNRQTETPTVRLEAALGRVTYSAKRRSRPGSRS
jgi:hypothetical protein